MRQNLSSVATLPIQANLMLLQNGGENESRGVPSQRDVEGCMPAALLRWAMRLAEPLVWRRVLSFCLICGVMGGASDIVW